MTKKIKTKSYKFLDQQNLNRLANKLQFFICTIIPYTFEIDINQVNKWFRKNYFTAGYDIIPFGYDLKHEDRVMLIEALYKELKIRYGLRRLSKRYGVLELTYNQFNNMYNLMRLKGDI